MKPCLLTIKRQGFYSDKNLAVPLFLPPKRPLTAIKQPPPAVSVGFRPSYLPFQTGRSEASIQFLRLPPRTTRRLSVIGK